MTRPSEDPRRELRAMVRRHLREQPSIAEAFDAIDAELDGLFAAQLKRKLAEVEAERERIESGATLIMAETLDRRIARLANLKAFYNGLGNARPS
jgi:hypothetical protein